MKKVLSFKSISGFLLALVSVAGVNFVPLEMWLDRDFSAETLMIVYAVENAVAFALGIAFVRLFAPARDSSSKLKTRREVLELYLALGAGFGLASSIFMVGFIFLVLRAPVDFAAVAEASVWIFGFQLLLFAADALMLRPLDLLGAQLYLNRSLGRIFLLFLCVCVGFAVAFFVEKWFVLPFIVLKTITDVGEQIQIFTGKGEEKVNPLTEDYGKK
jgi:hypothetical protein